jgi:hypothetical protein
MLKKVLYLVDYLSHSNVPKLLNRLKSSTSSLIQNEVFKGKISQRTSREYANFLLLLASKMRDLI